MLNQPNLVRRFTGRATYEPPDADCKLKSEKMKIAVKTKDSSMYGPALQKMVLPLAALGAAAVIVRFVRS